jgi:hypothetical protein
MPMESSWMSMTGSLRIIFNNQLVMAGHDMVLAFLAFGKTVIIG